MRTGITSILVVEDNRQQRHYLLQLLITQGYAAMDVHSAEAAMGALQRFRFDLVLLDITLPGLDGLGMLRYIRDEYRDLRVIMITGHSSLGTALEAMRNGADDYIVKSNDSSELLTGIRRTLASVQQQNGLQALPREKSGRVSHTLSELGQTYDQTIMALGAALDLRDSETETHCVRVAAYSLRLAREMGLDDDTAIRNLKWGAYLHDIGKIGIPDAILLKNGPLTDMEYRFIQKHPELGKRMLRKISFLEQASDIVYCHHERYDGTGYPQGLTGEQIPILARIFSVADAVDAMSSDRPYRDAMEWSYVGDELIRNTGSHFDPQVVDAFQQVPEAQWPALRDAPDLTDLN